MGSSTAQVPEDPSTPKRMPKRKPLPTSPPPRPRPRHAIPVPPDSPLIPFMPASPPMPASPYSPLLTLSQASPPMGTGSPSYSPPPLPTLEDLLQRIVKSDGVDGNSGFQLAEIPELRREAQSSSPEPAPPAVRTDDIVDRPGDFGYMNWVTKVLRPRLRGSPLIDAEPGWREENAYAGSGFWWMSREWDKLYRKDDDLGRLVKEQIMAVNKYPGRRRWTADTKSMAVGGLVFMLKDFSSGTEQEYGILARPPCATRCRYPNRCQSCTSCASCSACKTTSACGVCSCCQFTCCCRNPPADPWGPLACVDCGACGLCVCCLGTCCCCKRLDPTTPPLPDSVGCDDCRDDRARARATRAWKVGKYVGSPRMMAKRGVMVHGLPRMMTEEEIAAAKAEAVERGAARREAEMMDVARGKVPVANMEISPPPGLKARSILAAKMQVLERELGMERELLRILESASSGKDSGSGSSSVNVRAGDQRVAPRVRMERDSGSSGGRAFSGLSGRTAEKGRRRGSGLGVIVEEGEDGEFHRIY
ncbi:uncharacterized protein DNG_06770 [Cephalotrichum gorgonifer]|uniref:Uncharacterized protein n=1 Tax=Cephalotrichum gorgonifer TaxID=2041049 RepID=A0AAE8N138_9PEZI|nr:uncharacterized protein DNG_06770 [Cephalotrichum gorgonifer]